MTLLAAIGAGGDTNTETTMISLVDQTVNNSETLVNATSLSTSLLAGHCYIFLYTIYADSSAVADFKYTFAAVTNSVLPMFNRAFTQWTAALQTAATSFGSTVESAAAGVAGINGGIGFIKCVDAGTLQLQFAQATAEVSDTKLLEGSNIILWDMGVF